MIAPLDYYVIPFVVAVLGALLGRWAWSRTPTPVGLTTIAAAVVVALGTIAEILWHERQILQPGYRVGGLSLALALLLPLLLALGGAWAGGRCGGPLGSTVTAVVAGIIGIVSYPWLSILLHCEFVRDCL